MTQHDTVPGEDTDQGPGDAAAEHHPDFWPHWHPPELPAVLRKIPGWTARLAMESRLPAEIGAWALSREARGLDLPRAPRPGRPVLVIPGFGFGDPSIAQLHFVLRRLGYRTYRSHILLNVHCSDETVDRLAGVALEALVREAELSGEERLAVVGQSRGGMLARGLAARRPDLVDTAISLGGCLNDEFAFYELPVPILLTTRTVHHGLNSELRRKGCGTPECDCPYMRAAHAPMSDDVRMVSVYSREDGIVDWRSCVMPGADNVEVSGSHMGMGFNVEVTRAVAEALAAS